MNKSFKKRRTLFTFFRDIRFDKLLILNNNFNIESRVKFIYYSTEFYKEKIKIKVFYNTQI